MRRLACLAIITALAACSPPAEEAAETPAAEPAGNTVVSAPVLSAQGYGPVRIGMTPAEAAAALQATLSPPGPVEDPNSCHFLYIDGQPENQRLAFLVEEGRITSINDSGDETSMAPAANTAEGIGVGSTDAQVRAAYPNAVEQPAKYNPAPAHDLIVWTEPDQSGVRFEVNANGQVTDVHAGGRSFLYVEGCG